MNYEYKETVRYSLVDEELYLTLPAILDFFQDAAIGQSEQLGVGIRVLKARHLAWFLVSWDICVTRFPKLGETVTVGTYPYRFRSPLGCRVMYLKDESGAVLATADSRWVMMDTANLKMTGIPEDIAGAFELGEAPAAEGRVRIAVGDTGTELPAIPVQSYMLDVNGHVNNGQYVHLAEAFLPKDRRFYRLRAEYRKQAILGDSLIPRTDGKEECVSVTLHFPSGEISTVLEWSRPEPKRNPGN